MMHIDPALLPRACRILAGLSKGPVGGEVYDREWPERAKASMW